MNEDRFMALVTLILVTVATAHSWNDKTDLKEQLTVSFAEVRPIFDKKCSSCHLAPTDWTDYSTAFERRGEIKSRVWILRNMPPRGNMSEDERLTIKNWVDGGANP